MPSDISSLRTPPGCQVMLGATSWWRKCKDETVRSGLNYVVGQLEQCVILSSVASDVFGHLGITIHAEMSSLWVGYVSVWTPLICVHSTIVIIQYRGRTHVRLHDYMHCLVQVLRVSELESQRQTDGVSGARVGHDGHVSLCVCVAMSICSASDLPEITTLSKGHR